MDPRQDLRLLDVLERCAPGEDLREGLDRILRSGRGAIVVLGDGAEVQKVCSGGFTIDADFTPHRLSELAKMDGAIICDVEGDKIRRANVHLVPGPQVPTAESGIRHRTAERTARQTGAPVVAVSEAMHTVTVYVGDSRYTLDRVDTVLAKVNQALQTLQRYRQRFDEASGALSGLEVEDIVTLRDVVSILQRAEMALRIADDIEFWIVELGADGRLIRMQLEELLGRVEAERELVVRDYHHAKRAAKAEAVIADLAGLTPSELVDQALIARKLGHHVSEEGLDAHVTPRGRRMLTKIPRIPRDVEESIVRRFQTLPKIMRATLEQLDEVEGVGETRARAIKEGLQRLAETSLVDRYN
jgi:diadenylate cyclase